MDTIKTLFDDWSSTVNDGDRKGRPMKDAEIVDLQCDICGSPMKMSRDTNKTSFACTACEQRWFFDANGRGSCIIMGHIFPSNMDETKQIYREYLAWRMKQCVFDGKIRILCGLMTEQEAADQCTQLQKSIDERLDEIAARTIRPAWWMFWKRAA